MPTENLYANITLPKFSMLILLIISCVSSIYIVSQIIHGWYVYAHCPPLLLTSRNLSLSLEHNQLSGSKQNLWLVLMLEKIMHAGDLVESIFFALER